MRLTIRLLHWGQVGLVETEGETVALCVLVAGLTVFQVVFELFLGGAGLVERGGSGILR